MEVKHCFGLGYETWRRFCGIGIEAAPRFRAKALTTANT